jgi:hypothetical protein
VFPDAAAPLERQSIRLLGLRASRIARAWAVYKSRAPIRPVTAYHCSHSSCLVLLTKPHSIGGNLIQVYKERLLGDPDGTTVTIGSPDSEHIEVMGAIHGITVAKQLLKRSYQSESAAVMFGQHKRSFRCEPDSLVINSSYIHDWDVYSLPYEEKKRRCKKGCANCVAFNFMIQLTTC